MSELKILSDKIKSFLKISALTDKEYSIIEKEILKNYGNKIYKELEKNFNTKNEELILENSYLIKQINKIQNRFDSIYDRIRYKKDNYIKYHSSEIYQTIFELTETKKILIKKIETLEKYQKWVDRFTIAHIIFTALIAPVFVYSGNLILLPLLIYSLIWPLIFKYCLNSNYFKDKICNYKNNLLSIINKISDINYDLTHKNDYFIFRHVNDCQSLIPNDILLDIKQSKIRIDEKYLLENNPELANEFNLLEFDKRLEESASYDAETEAIEDQLSDILFNEDKKLIKSTI